MASHVVVITTDLRRANVKVTPGSFMLDVLEEACKKLNLSSDRYLLKHNNKLLNLTDPFRTSGLSPGAKLDLVVKSKTTSVVTIALRLPESEARLGIPNNRVSDKVRSDTPLWKLLRHFEETGPGKQKGLNLTARGVPQTSSGTESGSGQLYWEAPVLKVAGRELSSLEDFRKTLSQVGIDSGSQLILLEFKRTDVTLQAAMHEVERFYAEAEGAAEPLKEAPKPAATPSQSEPGKPAENEVQPEPEPASAISTESAPKAAAPAAQPTEATPAPAGGPEPMDVDTAPTHDSLRPVEVWAPARGTTPVAARRMEPDSAFMPSVAQMKAHQKHLEVNGLNKRLKSDQELEAEARAHEARLAAVKKVDIRVRFPDGHIVAWSFGPEATGATLHQAVLGVLATDAPRQFKLVLPAGGGAIANEGGERHTLIRGYDLKGGVLVSLVLADGVPTDGSVRKQTFLKSEVSGKAHEVVVPQVPEGPDEEEEAGGPAAAKPAKAPARSTDEGGEGSRNKIAKFLRLSKK